MNTPRLFAGALLLSALFGTLLSASSTTGLSADDSPVASRAAKPDDPCDISGVDRIVAIGDIHGAYPALVDILRASGLVDESLGWTGGRTHLVQTGDMVDRGPASRKVLDLMMRLEREAPKAGGRVHVLLGNHEVAVMLGDVRSSSAAEYEEFRGPDSEAIREQNYKNDLAAARRESAAVGQALDESAFRAAYMASKPPGSFERRVAFGPTGVYGRWLRGLPTVARINRVVFVHGGLNADTAGLGCSAINERVRADLTTNIDKTLAAPLKSLVARPDGPLWYRGPAQWNEQAFGPQLDAILRRLDARAIVGGHSVVAGGRIGVRFHGRVFQIDTGMLASVYAGGRPSALEFSGDAATAIYVDGRESLAIGQAAPPAGPAGSAAR